MEEGKQTHSQASEVVLQQLATLDSVIIVIVGTTGSSGIEHKASSLIIVQKVKLYPTFSSWNLVKSIAVTYSLNISHDSNNYVSPDNVGLMAQLHWNCSWQLNEQKFLSIAFDNESPQLQCCRVATYAYHLDYLCLPSQSQILLT